ncbi:MAG: hypothetical protein KF800_10970 [Lysobacter sp.]|nr:hypothetical protein [Lysobacter sp.]
MKPLKKRCFVSMEQTPVRSACVGARTRWRATETRRGIAPGCARADFPARGVDS